ncbi:MAG: alanine--tRNA ligase [Angelakisella sp.]|nr:alanine--tRNA ligase [Angelakisella sp.]
MEWTGLNELREKFLNFYESKMHTRLASAPLVPQEEASLLLINSGMAPLKKYFMGLATLPGGSKRATSCQKCIRTPDIENVGKTARHGTYFEMLGNFSFGDYFKEEATTWAWEFITKVLEMPVDKLYVSVYEDDDEAYEIWTKRRGVDPSHMVRLGKADNFWEIGSGPCGPCSEIYFDRGVEKGCGSPDCKVGCECDRFVEFWNLVFTQFNSDGEGNYTPLDHPNIDTGMGLERLACIMQGVDNLFEVDTVQNIMKHICTIAGVEYKKDPKTDVSIRVVTDHIRSTTFMIGDGVVPQNEGRGYVLRRLLRRAARHGRLLGINEPFLYKVCETVIGENAKAYPELVQNKDYIVKVIKLEEERFAKTIDQGLGMVNSLIEKLLAEGKTVFPGDEAFKLYDTYGFPIDLTKEIAEEKGLAVDEKGYQASMKVQRETAREATRAALGDAAWAEDVLKGKDIKSEFVGYTSTDKETELLAIIYEGELTDSLGDEDSAALVLAQTPFYAESGGQVGDTGIITCGSSIFEVYDCKKSPTGAFMHMGKVKNGVFTTGDKVHAQVDVQRRQSIMRNHSSCHLLQKALQDVLGSHVHQSGSYVDDKICRFDFSHFSAMTTEELAEVERRVNEMILEANPVNATEMPIEEAKKLGAMALFGEKYGDMVRVVNMNEKSIEFCGGTHVDNTAKLGLFKILKESSIAAGIRRIEATTGWGILRVMDEEESILHSAATTLKLGNPSELMDKIGALTADLKAKEKALSDMEQKMAAMKVKDLFAEARPIGSFRFVCAGFMGSKPEALRALCDTGRANAEDSIIVLTSTNQGKGNIAVGVGAAAVKAGIHAGKIVKAVTSVTGGSGGGRPDSAMGGLVDIFKIDEAMAQLPDVLLAMMK